MFETITLSKCQEDWRRELKQSMFLMGEIQEKNSKSELKEQLEYLCALLNNYENLKAKTLSLNDCPEDYLVGIRVEIMELFDFEAYIRYKLNEGNLIAEIFFTKCATTEEFPIEKDIEWKLDILKEYEVNDPAYIVANIKNHFIIYLGFQKIGRDVIFTVME